MLQPVRCCLGEIHSPCARSKHSLALQEKFPCPAARFEKSPELAARHVGTFKWKFDGCFQDSRGEKIILPLTDVCVVLDSSQLME